MEIFEDEGVDLNRVYVGHSNDTTDTEYLTGLLEKGVWIGLDRYPGRQTELTPDWEGRHSNRVETHRSRLGTAHNAGA